MGFLTSVDSSCEQNKNAGLMVKSMNDRRSGAEQAEAKGTGEETQTDSKREKEISFIIILFSYRGSSISIF